MADTSHSIDGQQSAGATPRHVAIIMDGNGRWAAERGLPRSLGHRSGVEAVRRTVKAAIELGDPLPHALQLLLRELDAPGRGDRRSDGR